MINVPFLVFARSTIHKNKKKSTDMSHRMNLQSSKEVARITEGYELYCKIIACDIASCFLSNAHIM